VAPAAVLVPFLPTLTPLVTALVDGARTARIVAARASLLSTSSTGPGDAGAVDGPDNWAMAPMLPPTNRSATKALIATATTSPLKAIRT